MEFAPTINLDAPQGRRISRHVRLAIDELDAPEPVASPAMLRTYEQLIMTGLLLDQPHNYSAALHRLDANVAPCDVRRAIDYMQAHLEAPLTLTDVIAAAGVPGRTLLKHFRDHHGMSPMLYLRGARLQRARSAACR